MHNTDENRDDEIVELLEQILEKLSSLEILSSIDENLSSISIDTASIDNNTKYI